MRKGEKISGERRAFFEHARRNYHRASHANRLMYLCGCMKRWGWRINGPTSLWKPSGSITKGKWSWKNRVRVHWERFKGANT